MTTVAPRPVPTRPQPGRRQVRGSALARILRTTDAKQIGIMYMVTAFAYFVVGGFMALVMRAELCGRDHSRMLFNVEVVSPSEFDTRIADLKERNESGSAQ